MISLVDEARLIGELLAGIDNAEAQAGLIRVQRRAMAEGLLARLDELSALAGPLAEEACIEGYDLSVAPSVNSSWRD